MCIIQKYRFHFQLGGEVLQDSGEILLVRRCLFSPYLEIRRVVDPEPPGGLDLLESFKPGKDLSPPLSYPPVFLRGLVRRDIWGLVEVSGLEIVPEYLRVACPILGETGSPCVDICKLEEYLRIVLLKSEEKDYPLLLLVPEILEDLEG